MSAASSGSLVAELLELLAIMAVDLGLDRVGAGHRGFLGHQRGRRAEREAGDVPDRLEQRSGAPGARPSTRRNARGGAPPGRHPRDQRARRANPCRAPRAGRHRSGSRHIRRPGRRAASTRVDARFARAPAVMRVRFMPRRRAMAAAPPSERIAFHPAIEIPRSDHCTWSQRINGVAMMSSRLVAPPVGAGRQPLEPASFDPGMVGADRARHGDRQRGEQRRCGVAARQRRKATQRERGSRAVRPALP